MRECLHCKKEFQPKRDTARYCSTSCRVMYNRKHTSPQKKAVEVKLEVLYNSLLEMVGKFSVAPSVTTYNEANIFKAPFHEVGQFEPVKTIGKSVTQHLKEISDLDTPYEYQQKTLEIENDLTLDNKDRKDLLLNIKLPKN